MKELTPKLIVSVVADYFEIQPHIFFRKTKDKEVIFTRQIAQYFLRKHTSLSLKRIGKVSIMYGRGVAHHHRTIMYSCEKVETEYLIYDKKLANDIIKLDNIFILAKRHIINKGKTPTLSSVKHLLRTNELLEVKEQSKTTKEKYDKLALDLQKMKESSVIIDLFSQLSPSRQTSFLSKIRTELKIQELQLIN